MKKNKQLKIGDKVKYTSTWLKSAGTIIDIQPALYPFVTEAVCIPARYRVCWDKQEYGTSGWLSEDELIVL